jgi:hypothetical protein
MGESTSADADRSREFSARLEQAAERFEAVWQDGGRPDLEEHLPADGPLRQVVLVELVHIDLERRLKAGEPARVEEYLRRYPELADVPGAVPALAAAEYRHRHRAEPDLTLTDYLQRFPRHRRHLGEAARALSATAWGVGAGAERGEASGWPSIPGYRILGELGRGGMGVVYQAWQESLDRPVALKVILAGEHAGSEERRRFQTEAEAAARLQHPNIVQVFEVGEHLRRPFFSMELVEGTSLADRAGGQLPPPRTAAALIAALARAVEHAHQRGIVHRDLKPANVLLTADGIPKITDFGLAKRLDRGDSQTQSGAILGTPAYMAPEQAAGKTKEIGPAADLYALGTLLYELLVGRPPFRADTPLETLQRVVSEEPCPPRRARPGIPADLEAICLQCLRKEPARRYGSAQELAEDLDRFLQGEPVRARRPGALDRLRRAGKRHREVVWAVAGAVVALSLAVLCGGFSSLGRPGLSRTSLRLAGAGGTEAVADPGTLARYPGEVGKSLLFEVTGSNRGPLWGTDVYTDDSSLATAAVHAGALAVGETGLVRVTILRAQESYAPSTRHGVTSLGYGPWARSFKIERVYGFQGRGAVEDQTTPGTLTGYRGQVGRTMLFEVTGSDRGSVWGTDVYTDDSALAAAAVHAGALAVGQKGIVRVTILPGQNRYAGSARHGVASGPWETWPGSFRIDVPGD